MKQTHKDANRQGQVCRPSPAQADWAAAAGTGRGREGAERHFPAAAGLVLSRDDGQRGAAGRRPGVGVGVVVTSGRHPRRVLLGRSESGRLEPVVSSFPGATWSSVSSRLTDCWETERAQRTTSPPACICACVRADAASFARLSFSPEAGRGCCPARGGRRWSRHVRVRAVLLSRGQLFSSPDAAGWCELSFSQLLALERPEVRIYRPRIV